MAFSSSEVDNILKQGEERFTNLSHLSLSSNHKVIADFLTGQIAALHGIVDSPANVKLYVLISLLEQLEDPTENDQLILDILLHPGIINYVKYFFFQWLTSYVFEKDDLKSVQAAQIIFQKAGYSASNIFGQYLFSLPSHPAANRIFETPGSPLKQFLIQHLPAQLYVHTQPYSAICYGSGDWNYYYLLLVEEAQPHLAERYIEYGLTNSPAVTCITLITHKSEKYMRIIEDWLQQPSDSEIEMQSRLNVAVCLGEYDVHRFGSLVAQASKNYLEQYVPFINKSRWEPGLNLKEFSGTSFDYVSYSAIAIHFAIQANKEHVTSLVTEWHNNKVVVSFPILHMLFFHLKQEALPYLIRALQADIKVGGIEYYRSIINLLRNEFAAGDYMDTIWNLVTTKSKPLRDLIAKIVTEMDTNAESKAILLLKNKNAEARQAGAHILSSFSSPAAIQAVTALLSAETNDNTRDIFLQIVEGNLPEHVDEFFIMDMIASAQQRNKLGKPIEYWLNEEEMPPLFYLSGKQLTQEEVRFLLYRMTRSKAMRSDREANYLIEKLDKEKAAPFAKYMLKSFIDKGTKPEYKYLLALSALLGNDDVVDKIRSTINHWIENKRGRMAEYGVGALALHGSDKALRWVEWYSRKYQNKNANVGAAASKALEDAAEELGISIHELGDRVVPDFGFNGLYKELSINDEGYRVFIDGNFKLCFFNEDNKKLKALPSGASQELKEELKMIGKEVRDVVRSQSNRLEHYLVIQRKWTAEGWKQCYLNNPVMFIYATKILWGVYDAHGLLSNSFLCLEDTSLVNIEDEEIELEEGQIVGIIHPLQLSETLLLRWKRKIFDISIDPIFNQVERTVSLLDPGDADKKCILDFRGKEAESGSIKSTLEKHGWRKGDGFSGYVDAFHLEDSTTGITATLEVQGVFTGGYGLDNDPKLGSLYFIDPAKARSKSLPTITDEKDERLVSLKNIPPIFYSEVRSNILSIKMKKPDARVLSDL